MGNRPPVKLDYARRLPAIKGSSVSSDLMAYLVTALVTSCVPPFCLLASIMAVYKGWQACLEMRKDGRAVDLGTVAAIIFSVFLFVLSLAMMCVLVRFAMQ